MTKPIRIAAFGDSITLGTSSGQVTEEQTYRRVLERNLNTTAGRSVQVINAGVGGDTTELALGRLESDVLRHDPDWCIVIFGVNDAGYYRPDTDSFADTPRVPADTYRSNLHKIIERLQSAGINPVLVTPVPMGPKYWGTHLEQYRSHGLNYLVSEYADIMRQVGNEYHVPVVDVFQEFMSRPGATEEFLPDGIHPNAEGQAIIAQALATFFAERLRS